MEEFTVSLSDTITYRRKIKLKITSESREEAENQAVEYGDEIMCDYGIPGNIIRLQGEPEEEQIDNAVYEILPEGE